MNIRAGLFLLLFLLGCNSKPTDSPSDGFTLSGRLIQGGSPLSRATVSVDNSDNMSAVSDTLGYFRIGNIPKGNHTLSIQKTNQDGSFYSRSSSISVQSDITLDAFILPKGVIMYPPTSTTNSITLYWSATDANDFREYKVYRHTTSGLDESTGELIHVATAINDTSFSDNNIPSGAVYYYRVYVMNEFGRLGGSNIVRFSTITSNILINGDFEEIDTNNKPTGWSTMNLYPIIDVSLSSNGRAHSGTNAMRGIRQCVAALLMVILNSVSQAIDCFKDQSINSAFGISLIHFLRDGWR